MHTHVRTYIHVASFLCIYLISVQYLLLTAVDSSYKIVSIVVCKELDDSVMKLGPTILLLYTYAQYYLNEIYDIPR